MFTFFSANEFELNLNRNKNRFEGEQLFKTFSQEKTWPKIVATMFTFTLKLQMAVIIAKTNFKIAV